MLAAINTLSQKSSWPGASHNNNFVYTL